jgi:hypothetical protein
VQHARQHYVVDELAAPGQKPLVFLARHAAADEALSEDPRGALAHVG